MLEQDKPSAVFPPRLTSRPGSEDDCAVDGLYSDSSGGLRHAHISPGHAQYHLDHTHDGFSPAPNENQNGTVWQNDAFFEEHELPHKGETADTKEGHPWTPESFIEDSPWVHADSQYRTLVRTPSNRAPEKAKVIELLTPDPQFRRDSFLKKEEIYDRRTKSMQQPSADSPSPSIYYRQRILGKDTKPLNIAGSGGGRILITQDALDRLPEEKQCQLLSTPVEQHSDVVSSERSCVDKADTKSHMQWLNFGSSLGGEKKTVCTANYVEKEAAPPPPPIVPAPAVAAIAAAAEEPCQPPLRDLSPRIKASMNSAITVSDQATQFGLTADKTTSTSSTALLTSDFKSKALSSTGSGNQIMTDLNSRTRDKEVEQNRAKIRIDNCGSFPPTKAFSSPPTLLRSDMKQEPAIREKGQVDILKKEKKGHKCMMCGVHYKYGAHGICPTCNQVFTKEGGVKSTIQEFMKYTNKVAESVSRILAATPNEVKKMYQSSKVEEKSLMKEIRATVQQTTDTSLKVKQKTQFPRFKTEVPLAHYNRLKSKHAQNRSMSLDSTQQQDLKSLSEIFVEGEQMEQSTQKTIPGLLKTLTALTTRPFLNFGKDFAVEKRKSEEIRMDSFCQRPVSSKQSSESDVLQHNPQCKDGVCILLNTFKKGAQPAKRIRSDDTLASASDLETQLESSGEVLSQTDSGVTQEHSQKDISFDKPVEKADEMKKAGGIDASKLEQDKLNGQMKKQMEGITGAVTDPLKQTDQKGNVTSSRGQQPSTSYKPKTMHQPLRSYKTNLGRAKTEGDMKKQVVNHETVKFDPQPKTEDSSDVIKISEPLKPLDSKVLKNQAQSANEHSQELLPSGSQKTCDKEMVAIEGTSVDPSTSDESLRKNLGKMSPTPRTFLVRSATAPNKGKEMKKSFPTKDKRLNPADNRHDTEKPMAYAKSRSYKEFMCNKRKPVTTSQEGSPASRKENKDSPEKRKPFCFVRASTSSIPMNRPNKASMLRKDSHNMLFKSRQVPGAVSSVPDMIPRVEKPTSLEVETPANEQIMQHKVRKVEEPLTAVEHMPGEDSSDEDEELVVHKRLSPSLLPRADRKSPPSYSIVSDETNTFALRIHRPDAGRFEEVKVIRRENLGIKSPMRENNFVSPLESKDMQEELEKYGLFEHEEEKHFFDGNPKYCQADDTPKKDDLTKEATKITEEKRAPVCYFDSTEMDYDESVSPSPEKEVRQQLQVVGSRNSEFYTDDERNVGIYHEVKILEPDSLESSRLQSSPPISGHSDGRTETDVDSGMAYHSCRRSAGQDQTASGQDGIYTVSGSHNAAAGDAAQSEPMDSLYTGGLFKQQSDMFYANDYSTGESSSETSSAHIYFEPDVTRNESNCSDIMYTGDIFSACQETPAEDTSESDVSEKVDMRHEVINESEVVRQMSETVVAEPTAIGSVHDNSENNSTQYNRSLWRHRRPATGTSLGFVQEMCCMEPGIPIFGRDMWSLRVVDVNCNNNDNSEATEKPEINRNNNGWGDDDTCEDSEEETKLQTPVSPVLDYTDFDPSMMPQYRLEAPPRTPSPHIPDFTKYDLDDNIDTGFFFATSCSNEFDNDSSETGRAEECVSGTVLGQCQSFFRNASNNWDGWFLNSDEGKEESLNKPASSYTDLLPNCSTSKSRLEEERYVNEDGGSQSFYSTSFGEGKRRLSSYMSEFGNFNGNNNFNHHTYDYNENSNSSRSNNDNSWGNSSHSSHVKQRSIEKNGSARKDLSEMNITILCDKTYSYGNTNNNHLEDFYTPGFAKEDDRAFVVEYTPTPTSSSMNADNDGDAYFSDVKDNENDEESDYACHTMTKEKMIPLQEVSHHVPELRIGGIVIRHTVENDDDYAMNVNMDLIEDTGNAVPYDYGQVEEDDEDDKDAEQTYDEVGYAKNKLYDTGVRTSWRDNTGETRPRWRETSDGPVWRDMRNFSKPSPGGDGSKRAMPSSFRHSHKSPMDGHYRGRGDEPNHEHQSGGYFVNINSAPSQEPINDNSSENRRTSETPEPDSPVGKQPKNVVLQEHQQKPEPKPELELQRKENKRKKAPPCHLTVMGESMSLTIGTAGEKDEDSGTVPDDFVAAAMTQLRRTVKLNEVVNELKALPTHPEIKNWYPPKKWTLFEPSPSTSEDEEDAEETVEQARGRKKQKAQDTAASSRVLGKNGRLSQETVGNTISEKGRSPSDNGLDATQKQDTAGRKVVKKRASYYVDQDLDAEDRLRCKVLHDQLSGSNAVKVMPPRVRGERLWKIKPRTPETQVEDQEQAVAKEEETEQSSSVSKQTGTDSETKKPQDSPIPGLGRVSNPVDRNSLLDQETEQERSKIPEVTGSGLEAPGESMMGEGEEEEEEIQNEEEREDGGSGEKDEGGIQGATSNDIGKMVESREAILADEGEKEEDIHDTKIEEQEV